MSENSKRKLFIISTMFAVFLMFSGSLVVFMSSHSLSENKNIAFNEQMDTQKLKEDLEEESNIEIEINNDLEISLRNIIPNISACGNMYLYKQYNQSNFNETDITSLDRTSDFEGCTLNYKVYTLKDNMETNNEYVYIYDYVLLENNGVFGKSTVDMGISEKSINRDILEDGSIVISEKSFKGYGGLYKYTFKLDNNAYRYISTSYVR